ncbi:MAG: SRPBCC domain-containing protein [Neomegalonema sp.]|nr:SRPBCC domain-containing protein [Neomegalonema sp.]
MNFMLSEPGAEPIIIEGWFRADPARMFRAWTQPEELKQWFGHKPKLIIDAKVDLRLGGGWRFTFPSDGSNRFGFEGEYLEIIPDEKLAFTWRRFSETDGEAREITMQSQVEVRFVSKGAGVLVRLEHRALEDDPRKRVGSGWSGSFGNLEDLFGLAG